MRSSPERALVVALAVLALPWAASAQQSARLRILGVYDEVTFQPLAGADVIDLATRTFATTTATGTVSLAWLNPGVNFLQIRKLGYASKLQPVSVSPAETISVTVVMTPLIQTLPTVLTMGRSAGDTVRKLAMSGFYERSRSSAAPGSAFVTSKLLDHIALLGDLPSRTGQRFCLQNLYIDGVRVTISQDMAMPGGRYRSIVAPPQRNGIDNLLRPDEVAGVEMYNARNVPAQYNVTALGASCGATLIWTK